MTARFPLQPRDARDARRWLEEEADAAREILGRTRFATPEPVAIGEPGSGYPMPWSVQTWIPGAIATDEDPGDSVAFAQDLAELIAQLRAVDTRGRTLPGGAAEGVVREHDEWMETCFRESAGLLDVARLRRLWAEMRELPRGDAADVMTHGDLVPGNVLVAGGRLVGVLDVGGFAPADPALDLVGAWHLLGRRAAAGAPRGSRRRRAEWQRGRAWAFVQAMGAAWYYERTNPAMSRMGVRTLARVTADG